MNPERHPLGPLVDLFRSLPVLTGLLLALPFLAPAVTEWLVVPLRFAAHPLPDALPPRPDAALELARLRQDNETLRQTVRELRGLDKSPLTTTATRTLARNLGSAPGHLQRSLIIDAGRSEGVENGDVVEHDGTLIGFVAATRQHWSRVALTSDSELNIAVQIVPRDSRDPGPEGWPSGLAGGHPLTDGSPTLEVRHVVAARHADVHVGDRVLTSGTDFSAPAGLELGRVTSVDNQGLFLTIKVSPTRDPATLRAFRLLIAPENPFLSVETP